MTRLQYAVITLAVFTLAMSGAFAFGLWVERLYADRQLNQMQAFYEGANDAVIATIRAEARANAEQVAQFNFARGAFAWCVESGGNPQDCNDDVQAWWPLRWQVFTEGLIWKTD
jgi:hypothetical protein